MKAVRRVARVLCAACLLCALVPVVNAHGDWPAKHGGIMNDGGETTFELIVRRGKVTLYLEDHGVSLPTQGSRGTLSVTGGTTKRSVDLEAAGANRLQSVQPMALTKGDRAVARVVLGNGSIVVGRFVVR